MAQSDEPVTCHGNFGDDPSGKPKARLRLYIARSTPNSARAERNLSAALHELEDGTSRSVVEIIDVFVQPKRAIIDGVVVTPTLIGSTSDKRVILMGDLSNELQLQRVLQDLVSETHLSSDGQPSGPTTRAD